MPLNINIPTALRKAIITKSRYLKEYLLESVTLSVFGQELFIALSDDNWTTKNENEEAYLACPKTGIIDTNIKMVLNTVMEQDSENPTPKLDKEPLISCKFLYTISLISLTHQKPRHLVLLYKYPSYQMTWTQ
ncbi:hypothetical protein SAMN04489757_1131 [Anaerocolumna aminovalerica]|uniref:Uncharacterized protein n=1 Tax=Anaerocolumna aminovalerica TaxID=1527 RepID=A0A1I5FA69_9FIRM|nr:hypothetical protein SAMN04489757_1131 [Anaerocolumna aminovalerica]